MPTTYAIPDGRTVMAATLWTGTGNVSATQNNSVNGVSFQPDFVWVKAKSTVHYHALFDSVRGTGTNALASNTPDGQTGISAYANLTSFNSNGFSSGTTSATNILNDSGQTFVGWQWKAGGTAVSNTSGTITSSVSANTTAGFSVVTWTAPASTGTHTVGHGLGVAPSMIIAKTRGGGSGGGGWAVYFTTLGNSAGLALNTNAAPFSSANYWGSSNPTSTVFGLNDAASASGYDNNTGNMVAYCFAAVAGYSAFGNYPVNNSANGPFIYTGFRPRWILIRNTGASGWNWTIIDTSRNTYNVANAVLYPDLSNAEGTANNIADILSNGFKIRTTWGNINTEGPVIYAAFAENPFKYANAK